MMKDRYRVRRPALGDLPAVIELMRTVDTDYGDDDDPTEYLTTLFKVIDLDRDAWVVEAGDGRIVAVAGLRLRHPTRIHSVAGVLPEHRGRGLGSTLLDRIEERARELAADGLAAEEVWLGIEAASSNEQAKALFESRGFELIRHFWKMGTDLDTEPPEPEWPNGIRLEHARRGDERAVFDASEDAFQDHWDHQPHDYREWRTWMVDSESYDPANWLLARDSDEIAGISLLFMDSDEGRVALLGVRPPWRGRGVGKALLLASFHQLREAGKPRAVLGVDAANPTGATRLYASAGMRVLTEVDTYRLIVG